MADIINLADRRKARHPAPSPAASGFALSLAVVTIWALAAAVLYDAFINRLSKNHDPE